MEDRSGTLGEHEAPQFFPLFTCQQILELLTVYDSLEKVRSSALLVVVLEVHHHDMEVHRPDCPLRDPEHWISSYYLHEPADASAD